MQKYLINKHDLFIKVFTCTWAIGVWTLMRSVQAYLAS